MSISCAPDVRGGRDRIRPARARRWSRRGEVQPAQKEKSQDPDGIGELDLTVVIGIGCFQASESGVSKEEEAQDSNGVRELKATGNRRTLSSEAVRYGTPLEELILDFDPVTGIATTSTTR